MVDCWSIACGPVRKQQWMLEQRSTTCFMTWNRKMQESHSALHTQAPNQPKFAPGPLKVSTTTYRVDFAMNTLALGNILGSNYSNKCRYPYISMYVSMCKY